MFSVVIFGADLQPLLLATERNRVVTRTGVQSTQRQFASSPPEDRPANNNSETDGTAYRGESEGGSGSGKGDDDEFWDFDGDDC
jgi:hypothetical protein